MKQSMQRSLIAPLKGLDAMIMDLSSILMHPKKFRFIAKNVFCAVGPEGIATEGPTFQKILKPFQHKRS